MPSVSPCSAAGTLPPRHAPYPARGPQATHDPGALLASTATKSPGAKSGLDRYALRCSGMHARSRCPKRSAWRGQAHARSPGTGSARPWPPAPSSQTARKLHSMPDNMRECSPPSMCGKKGEPPGHPTRTAAAADAASARPRGWQHTPWPRAPAPARGRRVSTGKAIGPRCRACKRCTSEPALVHDPALTWQTMHLPRRPPCRHTAWADETVKQRSAELQEHAGSLPRLHAQACQ